MIRAAHGEATAVEGKPLPTLYDLTGRGRYMRHGTSSTVTAPGTAAKQASGRKKSKASRAARKRNRR